MKKEYYIKLEFNVPVSLAIAFKKKFNSLLSKKTFKEILYKIIKDELFRTSQKDYYNPKYYTENDVREIFNIKE